MDILINCLWVLIGLVGLVFSADKFVQGASNISLNLGIPSIIVGVVIVGIGTSSPEILVSAQAALEGKSELSLGNAIGSNIANIAFIIGITALIVPIAVAKQLIKKEFAIMIGTTLLGAFLISDGSLSRFDALILLGTLIFIMYFMVSTAMAEKNKPSEVSDEPSMSLKKSIIVTIIGMLFLVLFSKLLVFGAVNIATTFGVSELVIGLTIIAIGTSLPELAACIAAARKGCPDLAIGNVLGSNIFNILAVIGIGSFISPFEVSQEVLDRDLPLLLFLSFVFIIVAFSPKGDGKINRFEGFSFLIIFITYMIALIGESLGWFDLSKFLFG
jgi:cation:H+ antiporter